MLRLTVLGASGGHPMAGQACSGFLLEWGSSRVVLDLGYGTLPQLLTYVPDGNVDAVVITHEHPDHCADLHALFRVRHYGHPDAPRIPLYCPAEVLDRLAGLEPDVDLGEVFDHHALPGDHPIGPLRLSARTLPHYVPTVGVHLSRDQTSVAYATDTGPDKTLVELGRDADLYILDATDRPGEADHAERNLLTSTEAGEWAQRARARRLLLTHLWPGTNPTTALQRAQRAFDGPVQAAVQGLIVTLAD